MEPTYPAAMFAAFAPEPEHTTKTTDQISDEIKKYVSQKTEELQREIVRMQDDQRQSMDELKLMMQTMVQEFKDSTRQIVLESRNTELEEVKVFVTEEFRRFTGVMDEILDSLDVRSDVATEGVAEEVHSGGVVVVGAEAVVADGVADVADIGTDEVKSEVTKAELEKAELENAELEKAELEKAELEKAELEKAELEKAELEKAKLVKAELEKAELEKAKLEKAELEKAKLVKAELEKAELEKAELEKAELEKAKLVKAELEKAELEKAELEKAELEKAELEKAELEKADLEKADLEKAELEKAEQEKAELERAKVTKSFSFRPTLRFRTFHHLPPLPIGCRYTTKYGEVQYTIANHALKNCHVAMLYSRSIPIGSTSAKCSVGFRFGFNGKLRANIIVYRKSPFDNKWPVRIYGYGLVCHPGSKTGTLLWYLPQIYCWKPTSRAGVKIPLDVGFDTGYSVRPVFYQELVARQFICNRKLIVRWFIGSW